MSQKMLLTLLTVMTTLIPPAVAAAATVSSPDSNKNTLTARLAKSDPVTDTVTAMMFMRRAEFPSFSPDDKTVCFLSTLSGKPELWTMPTAGGWPMQITLTKEGVIGEQWSPTSDLIAFMVGAGKRDLYTVRADGTEQKHYDYSVALNDWTADGKQIMFASNVTGKKEDNTWLLDPATGKLEQAGKMGDAIYDVSPDRKFALLCNWTHNSDTNLSLCNLKSGEQHLITPEKGAMYSGGHLNRNRPYFSADGKAVWLVSNEGRRSDNGFARIKLSDDGKPSPLEYIEKHDGASLYGFALDQKRTTAALDWVDQSGSRISIVDLASGKATRIASMPMPSTNVKEIAISHDGRTVAVSACDIASTYDIYLLDIATEHWRRLTDSSHPGVDLAKLSRPEHIEYKTAEGQPCEGWLYQPSSSKPCAYVINLMGRDSGFGLLNQTLLSQGLGVVVPVCHSSGHNKGEKAINDVHAIKGAIDYLVGKKLADPKRIGIYGFSHFGLEAVAAAVEYPDSIAACVDSAGPVDFEIWGKQRGKFMVNEYGNPEPGSALMEFLCPIRRAERIKAAMMVQQGMKDDAVKPDCSLELIENFKKRGVPIETVIFPDEGHSYSQVENEIKATSAMVSFFTKHLMDDKVSSLSNQIR